MKVKDVLLAFSLMLLMVAIIAFFIDLYTQDMSVHIPAQTVAQVTTPSGMTREDFLTAVAGMNAPTQTPVPTIEPTDTPDPLATFEACSTMSAPGLCVPIRAEIRTPTPVPVCTLTSFSPISSFTCYYIPNLLENFFE